MSGFTIVEIVFALLILTVLGAVAMAFMQPARQRVSGGTALAVATTYASAVDAYKRDHHQNVPELSVTSAYWPVAAIAAGPIDLLGRPYLKSTEIPDAIGNKSVVLIGATADVPDVNIPSLTGYVQYTTTATATRRGYAFQVFYKVGSSGSYTWKARCVLSDLSASAVPGVLACS